MEALTQYAPSDLLRFQGLGKKSLQEIAALLRMRGLRLRDEGVPEWVFTEARKADWAPGYFRLENPALRESLDRLLIKTFWPVVQERLKATGYQFFPEEIPEAEFATGPEIGRSFIFMLLDPYRFEAGPRAFFKGEFIVSETHWMLNRESWLSLPKHTQPQVLFEILGNSRFRGNPPSMRVDREKEGDFYQIDFRAGDGTDWTSGILGDEQRILKKIKHVIDVSVRMHEFARRGISPEGIGEFSTIVYEAY